MAPFRCRSSVVPNRPSDPADRRSYCDVSDASRDRTIGLPQASDSSPALDSGDRPLTISPMERGKGIPAAASFSMRRCKVSRRSEVRSAGSGNTEASLSPSPRITKAAAAPATHNPATKNPTRLALAISLLLLDATTSQQPRMIDGLRTARHAYAFAPRSRPRVGPNRFSRTSAVAKIVLYADPQCSNCLT
jgi:hypothetical protein